MVGNFNFDFTNKNKTTTATGYTITGFTNNNPKQVDIVLTPPSAGKCEFDAYYYNNNGNNFAPDYNGGSDTTSMGCNTGANSATNSSLQTIDCNTSISGCSFKYIFEQFNPNLKNAVTIENKNNGSKNYCHFSIDLNDGEDCSSFGYGDVLFNFKKENGTSNISNGNGAQVVSGTSSGGITGVNVTCGTSVIPYSYSGFTPTFDSSTSKLTFTPNNSAIETKSLGGTDSNSIATYITDIDQWNGNFKMSFNCGIDSKLRTDWGNLVFDSCPSA